MKQNYWYRIAETSWYYYPQYRRGMTGEWHTYKDGRRLSWDSAYAVLLQHANATLLLVRFVDTF